MEINNIYYVLHLNIDTFNIKEKLFTNKIMFSNETIKNISGIITPKMKIIYSKNGKYFIIPDNLSSKFNNDEIIFFNTLIKYFNDHDDGKTFKIFFNKNIDSNSLCSSLNEILSLIESKISYDNSTFINNIIHYYVQECGLFKFLTEFTEL